jgi:hypothetical protein
VATSTREGDDQSDDEMYNGTEGSSRGGGDDNNDIRRLGASASSSGGAHRLSSLVATSMSGADTSATTAISLSLAAMQRRDHQVDGCYDVDEDNYFAGGGGGDRTGRAGLPARAMGATLKRLSLADQYQIPQHLIDTLFVDVHNSNDRDKATKKEKEGMGQHQKQEGHERNIAGPLLSPSKAADPATIPATSATATSPRLLLRRGQHVASLSSVNIVSSGEYDGDDDSDAILRSRRSSQEEDDDNNGEGDASTLPSAEADLNHHDDAYYYDPNHDPQQYVDDAPWDRPRHVVVGRFASETGWSQRQEDPVLSGNRNNGAVAAILQSISDELHHVDQIVSTSGGGDDDDDDDDDDAYFPDQSLSTATNLAQQLEGESKSGIVVASATTIPPSDTMQAVVVSHSTSTTTHTATNASSSYRYLPHSDTNQAVTSATSRGAAVSSSTSSSGRAILPSETMRAVVNGRPVPAADRPVPAAAADGLLFPPNLTLTLSVPSPSARSTPSAWNSRGSGMLSPPSSDVKLVVSPGRIPAYPIDLSEAPSPPQGTDQLLHERHSFSFPEERIRALYNEESETGMAGAFGGGEHYPAASTWQHRRTMSSSPTARLGRSVPPYARGGEKGRSEDRDVIERARIAIASSVSATSRASDDAAGRRGVSYNRMPPQPPMHDHFAAQGTRHVVAGTASSTGPSRRPPPPALSVSSRASGVTNSSVEPDSDAAVVVALLPPQQFQHQQHCGESYPRFEEPRTRSSHSDVEATTPRTKPGGAARRRDGAAPAPPGVQHSSSKLLSSPVPNPPSREDDDYDTWLDSALATQTFDEPNGGDGDGAERNVGSGAKSAHDPRKHSLLEDDDDDFDNDDDDSEPLRDWLDSVLP